MVKITSTRLYLTSQFTKSFLTIFLPFFLIIALIYLVKISALTAQIRLSFLELLQLFSYSVPDILYYTIPLSFIAALTTFLVRLSMENELIALYATGFSSKQVLQNLFIIGLLFALLLYVISFIAMPTSKQLYKSFKEEKKADAQLNIVPGKLGQKFGDYYIYVKTKENDIYRNVVIYNRTNVKKEQFFASRYGQIRNHSRHGSLFLVDGYGYTYGPDTLRQAKYNTLEVFNRIRQKPFHFQDIVAYWKQAKYSKKIRHRAFFFAYISLIPLLAVYIVSAFSMINPRYQNEHSYLTIFVTTLLFYLVGSSLEKWGNIYLLFMAVGGTLLIGYYLFKIRVLRYF